MNLHQTVNMYVALAMVGACTMLATTLVQAKYIDGVYGGMSQVSDAQ